MQDDGIGLSESSQAQILSLLMDGGTLAPFSFLARETAMGFPAFARSITLLSGMMAQLITRGALHVYDITTKERITTRKARESIRLLAESPDGIQPALPFVEDLACDYLIDGNCLIVPNDSRDGRTLSLQRGLARDAVRLSRGATALSIPLESGDTVTRARVEIILCRWPRTTTPAIHMGMARMDFAPSNIDILRHTLHIGLASDNFIEEFFKTVRGKRHLNFAVLARARLQPAQLGEYVKAVDKQVQEGGPYVFGDASVQNLNEKASDADSETLRQRQTQSVAAYYGIPSILVGEEASTWGAGIEQLMKGFIHFGLGPHLSRFLDPFSFHMLPRGQKFAIDHSEMVAASVEALTKLAIAAGGNTQTPSFMTNNERRGLFGMEPNDSIPTTPYKPPAGVTPPASPPAPEDEEREGGQND